MIRLQIWLHDFQENKKYDESILMNNFELTICFRTPYYKYEGVIDEKDYEEYEQHKKVAQYFCWTHR